MMRTIVAALLLFASPAFAQTAPMTEGAITCAAPVASSDSAQSLRQRYGQDAVIQDLPGAEGETYKGLVLFPKAMDQRIEVSFVGDKLKRASGLAIRTTAKTSRWSIAGVTIGSSLADVQKANGKAFAIHGFDWDYGGYVADWKGGTFGKPQPGGCRVTMRFGKDTGATPRGMSGEGVKVASDSAALMKWGPVVTEIGVNFPHK